MFSPESASADWLPCSWFVGPPTVFWDSLGELGAGSFFPKRFFRKSRKAIASI